MPTWTPLLPCVDGLSMALTEFDLRLECLFIKTVRFYPGFCPQRPDKNTQREASVI
jgi:hypothetical protein